MSATTVSAHEEYTQRLSARRNEAQRLARRERQISNSRMAVFVVGALFSWYALDTHRIAAGWIVLPVAVFIVLIFVHDRIIRERRRFDRAVVFYERGLARLEDRWAGGGEDGARFLDGTHPYAADLDIFGRGSLFELLCTARTRAGEDMLAAWLRAPAAANDVCARQVAVAELRPYLDLREELALLGADVRAGLDPDMLAAWGTGAPILQSSALRVGAAVIAALAVVAGIGWAAGVVGPWPFLAAYAIEGMFALALRSRVLQIIHAVQRPGRELDLLSQLLSRLEAEHFTSPRLVALRNALDTDGEPPSKRIAQLHRLIHLLDARKNQLFGPLSGVLLWATQLGLALEAWRAANGPAVGRWLATIGEFEALGALAVYAYEHANDPFPEITEARPCFDGEDLGHPLLPESRCVRNDIHLGRDLRLLIVSGSNMSGKSTLLRTVGINTVLALAGAPVRARRLRISPLAVGASIRILDSLQTGTSHFYAEITRLRQLLDLAKPDPPLLFLLDEILNGTNSHDRGIGAAAIIRGFLTRGAIGLVTTHDLALTHLVDACDGRAANVHFEDHLENGTMRFDYRMHPGVVQKSNAVELMRAVGLDV